MSTQVRIYGGAHASSRGHVVDSTNRRVAGLTFAQACALREAAGRGAEGDSEMDDMGSTRTTGRYGLRMRVTEIVLWLGVAGLGLAELLLAAAVWVIATVAPLARALADRVVDLVNQADGVMDDRPPEPQEDQHVARRADPPAPEDEYDPPSVVDGEVLWIDTNGVRVP